MSVNLTSSNSTDLDDLPAKKQKIDNCSDVSCSGNPADNGNSKEMAEMPSTSPREFQAVNTFDVARVTHAPVSVAENSPRDDPSYTDDDFRLPALRMPQVFDFSSLSYDDRRDGVLKIVQSDPVCGREIQQIFAYFVADETPELKGRLAVWRSVELACDVLVQMDEVYRRSFPIMMMVELVEPFCCIPGPSCTTATEEQVIAFLKDNDYRVNVIELFPVHDDSGDIDEAALVIEHTRFFFNYIWRLSDISNFMYAANKFLSRHFEPRLKLYFDVMEQNVSPSLALKYQNTITEYQTKYRLLRKKQDYIEKYDEYDDTHSGGDIDNCRDLGSETGGNTDKETGKDRYDSREDDDTKCHLDQVNDGDVEESEAKVQDQSTPMDRDTTIVSDVDTNCHIDHANDSDIKDIEAKVQDQKSDTDSDKDKDIDKTKDTVIKDNDAMVKDRDIPMDSDTKFISVDTGNDNHNNNIPDKDCNGGQHSDKDQIFTNQDGKVVTPGDNEDNDLPEKRFPQLEVFEISRLWKDIELLEDTLEMMENPVMRHLMEIPRKGFEHRKNSSVIMQQPRRHSDPVTHIVADKITFEMIQNLQLPGDTVLETHRSPASAIACCYDNDTILILPGTYPGDGLTDIVCSVTIRGIGDPEDIVIISKCRDPADLFVCCYSDHLTISNLTFIDESDSAHFRGLLEVCGASTRLVNCRFICSSTGVVVNMAQLDIESCKISGAQAPGIHTHLSSVLNMRSCYIHDCGKTDDAALAEDTCGVRIDSPQQLVGKVPKSRTSVKISNCTIQRNAGPGILLKIYSTDKQEEAKAADLGDLCTLTCCDLQVADNDFTGNAKGVAMVSYCKMKE